MGWGKYALLGQLGNRLDLDEADRKLKRMRVKSQQRRITQISRDEAQDDRLFALERENDEMKLLFMELMNVLADRGVLGEQETVEIVKRVESVVPDPIDGEDDPLGDLAAALSD